MTVTTTRMTQARPQTLLTMPPTVKEKGGRSPEDNKDDGNNSNTSGDDTSKSLLQLPYEPATVHAYTRV
jgi:hypothetical protein